MKALGEVEYEGQMCQAVLVFITWDETDVELIKQKSFKANLGEPSDGSFLARKFLGVEEQICKFRCIFFIDKRTRLTVHRAV
jgi:hypothetical protein